MTIPTQADRDLSEIDDLVASIKVRLSIMRRSANFFRRKPERDRETLRKTLQTLVDKVMALAEQ